MPVLFIISKILKSGAEIYRDKSDGQLALKDGQLIPEEVIEAAKPIFDKIDAYYQSVEGMNKVDTTAWKMIVALCGWQKNEAISNFLNNDEIALNLFMDYQAKLAINGWKELYDDWRQYENAETEKLKVEIFNRAVAFKKGAK